MASGQSGVRGAAIGPKILLAAVLIVAVSLWVFNYTAQKFLDEKVEKFREQSFEVRGNSLHPRLPDGTQVTITLDPDLELPIARDDLVAYVDPGNPEAPLLKFVFGLPGDQLGFQNADGGYHLVINGEVARNSVGTPFVLDGRAQALLALYMNDYGGVPPDAYLVLGDDPAGGRDSTRFGLVDRSTFIGKVVR